MNDTALRGPLQEVAAFQTGVARHWIERADEVRGKHAFEFVAYFSALNALYWLWGLLDELEASTPEERNAVERALKDGNVPAPLASRVLNGLRGMKGESRLLANLVSNMPEASATTFVREHAGFMRHLTERGPIREMGRRSRSDAVLDDKTGRQLHRKLTAENSSSVRVQAVAGILYLIRCNLVHGSKISDALDGELLSLSVQPLRTLAEWAYNLTEARL